MPPPRHVASARSSGGCARTASYAATRSAWMPVSPVASTCAQLRRSERETWSPPSRGVRASPRAPQAPRPLSRTPISAAASRSPSPSCTSARAAKTRRGTPTSACFPTASRCRLCGLATRLSASSPAPSLTRQIVKQDREFLREDWKECIEPLVSSGELDVDPDDFSLEKYFSAKTLVSSRSFEIDDYHGFGMVPLADLFNHKTGGEHVHFTSVSDASDTDVEEDEDDESDASTGDQSTIENNTNSPPGASISDEDLEMIVVRDANEGDEVYNTYGTMGNAALLHRYGFTELGNQYDVVNIDLALVTKWCKSMFSSRHARTRVSLWRNLGYSGCTSQDAEYFEISYDGEPQLELLILLYIITLKADAYDKLICMADDLIVNEEHDSISSVVRLVKATNSSLHFELNGLDKMPDVKKLLHSKSISSALLSLADMRESLYGSNTLEDDEEKLEKCNYAKERKMYHSLVLRVSEKRILNSLRKYASSWSKAKKRKHR